MSAAYPLRVFYDEQYDQLIAITQNPCGCHCFDVLVEYSKTSVYAHTFSNDTEIEEFFASRGWIEL